MALNLSSTVSNAIRNATLARGAAAARANGATSQQLANSIVAAIVGYTGGAVAAAVTNSVGAPLPEGWTRAGKLRFMGKETKVTLFSNPRYPNQLYARIKKGGRFVKGFNNWKIVGNQLVWGGRKPKAIATPEQARQILNVNQQVPGLLPANRVTEAIALAAGAGGAPTPRKTLANRLRNVRGYFARIFGGGEPNIEVIQGGPRQNPRGPYKITTTREADEFLYPFHLKILNALMKGRNARPIQFNRSSFAPELITPNGRRISFENYYRNWRRRFNPLRKRAAQYAQGEEAPSPAGNVAGAVQVAVSMNNLQRRLNAIRGGPAGEANYYENWSTGAPIRHYTNGRTVAGQEVPGGQGLRRWRFANGPNATARVAPQNAASQGPPRWGSAPPAMGGGGPMTPPGARRRVAFNESPPAGQRQPTRRRLFNGSPSGAPNSGERGSPNNRRAALGVQRPSAPTPRGSNNGSGPNNNSNNGSGSGRNNSSNNGSSNGGPPPPPPSLSSKGTGNTGGNAGGNINPENWPPPLPAAAKNAFPKFIPSPKNVGRLSYVFLNSLNKQAELKNVQKMLRWNKPGYYQVWRNKGGFNEVNLAPPNVNVPNFVNVPNMNRVVGYKYYKAGTLKNYPLAGYLRNDVLYSTSGGNAGRGNGKNAGTEGNGGSGGGGRPPGGGGWLPEPGGSIFGRGFMRRLFGGGRSYYNNLNNLERNERLRWARGGRRAMRSPRGMSERERNLMAQMNELRRAQRGNGVSRKRPGLPGPQPTEREQIAEKFSSMMTANEKKAVNNMGGANTINKIFKEAGGPIEVSKAVNALRKFPNKTIAAQVTGVKPQVLNLVQNLGGPNRANLAISAVHKMNLATKSVKKAARAKRQRKAEKAHRDKIKATLLLTMAKKFTKNELVTLAGKNVLNTNSNNKKNNIVGKFVKNLRGLPKKRRVVVRPSKLTKKK